MIGDLVSQWFKIVKPFTSDGAPCLGYYDKDVATFNWSETYVLCTNVVFDNSKWKCFVHALNHMSANN